jgi:hypothetical protein
MALYNEANPYELIESAGLYDMRNAQLLRAELGDIDRTECTAEVTLLDTCDVELGNLEAVPFWYHCEFSTGTIEDLANGHLAFQPGDIVYLLFMPELGDTEQRLFIIGHVDIRGTKSCGTEYLVITMSGNGSAAARLFTIFDVGTMNVLDLTTFANFDEESPAAPLTFPASFQTYSQWIDYNFAVATPTTTVPVTITPGALPNLSFNGSTIITPGNYPDPMTCTKTFDGVQNGTGVDGSTVCSAKTRLYLSQNPSYAIYNEVSSVYNYNIYYEYRWNIFDGVTSETASVTAKFISTLENEYNYATSQETYNLSNTSAQSMSITCTLTPDLSAEVTRQSSYASNTTDGYFDLEDMEVPIQSGQESLDYSQVVNHSNVLRKSAFCIGAYGFYTLFVAPVYITRTAAFVYADTPNALVPLSYQPGFGYYGAEDICECFTHTPYMDDVIILKKNVLATATFFNAVEKENPNAPVSPHACLRAADVNLSTALATVAEEFLDFVWEQTEWTSGASGPTMTAYMKKQ